MTTTVDIIINPGLVWNRQPPRATVERPSGWDVSWGEPTPTVLHDERDDRGFKIDHAYKATRTTFTQNVLIPRGQWYLVIECESHMVFTGDEWGQVDTHSAYWQISFDDQQTAELPVSHEKGNQTFAVSVEARASMEATLNVSLHTKWANSQGEMRLHRIRMVQAKPDNIRSILVLGESPPKPPPAGTRDLLDYLRGDGRGYKLSSNEIVYTRLYPDRFLNMRNRNYWLMFADDDDIYTVFDMPSEDEVYAVSRTDYLNSDGSGGRPGQVWVPRRLPEGESFTGVAYVRHFERSTGRIIKQNPDVPTTILFHRWHDEWQGVQDVVELHWLVDGKVQERYFFARKIGLVGWNTNTPKRPAEAYERMEPAKLSKFNPLRWPLSSDENNGDGVIIDIPQGSQQWDYVQLGGIDSINVRNRPGGTVQRSIRNGQKLNVARGVMQSAWLDGTLYRWKFIRYKSENNMPSLGWIAEIPGMTLTKIESGGGEPDTLLRAIEVLTARVEGLERKRETDAKRLQAAIKKMDTAIERMETLRGITYSEDALKDITTNLSNIMRVLQGASDDAA